MIPTAENAKICVSKRTTILGLVVALVVFIAGISIWFQNTVTQNKNTTSTKASEVNTQYSQLKKRINNTVNETNSKNTFNNTSAGATGLNKNSPQYKCNVATLENLKNRDTSIIELSNNPRYFVPNKTGAGACAYSNGKYMQYYILIKEIDGGSCCGIPKSRG